MRTIKEHDEIISNQARNLAGTILNKARDFGHPYLWNTAYWHGYCDALDQSGQLWKLTKAIVIPKLGDMTKQ
jgi:hypothetical protein